MNYELFKERNILNNNQFGFECFIAKEALLKISSVIYDGLNNGKCKWNFFNIKRAFDIVDYEVLLSKFK